MSLWSPIVLLVAQAALADEPPSEEGLQVETQLQTWATLYDQDVDPQADPAGYGDPEHDTGGVTVHYATLGLIGLTRHYDGELEIGVGEPYDAMFANDVSFGLVDAYAGLHWAAPGGRFRLSVGTQKVPFSRDVLMSSEDLLFEEHSVGAEWIAPGRDAGILADYATDIGLRARVGMYNGDGDLFGDDNTGKLFVGRVEFAKGDTYRTWSQDGENALGVGAAAFDNTDVATGTMAAEIDVLARLHRVTFVAEGMQSRLAPRDADIAAPEVTKATKRLGTWAQISYFQPMKSGGIEVGTRFATFDDHLGISDNGDVGILHLGATWRDLYPGLDVGVGVIHRMELGGVSIANDTARAWLQIHGTRQLGGALASSDDAWTQSFVGTWTGSGDLDGAVLALWQQPGMGLVGSFKMTKAKGKVIVGRPYPLDSFNYDSSAGVLRVRLDPYGSGTDIVWFELHPSQDGQLCGYGYEDGKRPEAVAGTGGGAWVCWAPAPQAKTASY